MSEIKDNSESSQELEFKSNDAVRQLKELLSKPVQFVLKISVEICDDEKKQIVKRCPICKSNLDLISSKTKSYHCRQCGINVHHLEGED